MKETGRMKIIKLFASTILALASFFLISITYANCEGRFVNPITDICWDCLFPISIGNITIASSDYPDTENPSSPIEICLTEGFKIPRIGLTRIFHQKSGGNLNNPIRFMMI